MSIVTNTELVKRIAGRHKAEPIGKLCKELKVAEVYLLQILDGKRPISKRVAARLGYKIVPQPKPERLFQPLEK